MNAIASRVATARLEEGERRALDLRERGGAAYGQIASELGIEPREVAALLTSGRLRVREVVRDRPLPAIESDDCLRARPLLSMRQDGEPLEAEDRRFLQSHVGGCTSCRSARMALREGALAVGAALENDPLALAPAWGSVAPPPASKPYGAIPVPVPAPATAAARAEAEPGPEPDAPPPGPAAVEAARQEAVAAPAPRPARPVREHERRRRRVPAVIAIAVTASFVATLTTIFIGGDDPRTSSAFDREDATVAPVPAKTPDPATAAKAKAAAERRAAARRRRAAAKRRRERAERRRRRAAQAAAAPAPTATAAPSATPVPAPAPASTPAPQRERKRPAAPREEPADEAPEPPNGGNGGPPPPVPTDNPDGKPDVIPGPG
jgi:hypothetical protein